MGGIAALLRFPCDALYDVDSDEELIGEGDNNNMDEDDDIEEINMG